MRRRQLWASAAIVPIIGLAVATPAQAARPVKHGHPPAAVATTISCGAHITTNTTLTSDVGPCSTPRGVTLGGSNITLNLNGHRIFGDGNPHTTQIGVNVANFSGDTVENGQVYGFAVGVYLDVSNNDTVRNMYLHDNVGPRDGSGLYGEGLQIFRGGGHTITHNQIVHNGTFAGIDAYSTSDNTFTDNQVVDNNILQLDAIHLGPKVMQDIGIWVINLDPSIPLGATNNLVKGNEVVNNGLDGIQVARYTNGNRVADNEVIHNGFGQVKGIRDGDGIAVFGNNNIIQSNESSGNGANGIGIVSGGLNNQISKNRAFDNGSGPNSAGIAFDLTDGNTSPPCDSNAWSDNLFRTVSQSCVRSH